MRPLREWSLEGRAALGVLGAALLVLAVAVAGAVRLDPLPPAAAERVPAMPVTGLRLAVLPEGVAARLVEADPFSPDRATGFDDAPEGPSAEPVAAEVPPPAVRLLGVVLLPDGGGSAAVAVGGAPAQLVRVGQRVDRWVLVGVSDGAATLQAAGGSLVLRVERPRNGAGGS